MSVRIIMRSTAKVDREQPWLQDPQPPVPKITNIPEHLTSIPGTESLALNPDTEPVWSPNQSGKKERKKEFPYNDKVRPKNIAVRMGYISPR